MFVIIDYSYFAPVLTLVGLKLDRLIQFRFWLRPTSTLVEAGEIDPAPTLVETHPTLVEAGQIEPAPTLVEIHLDPG